MHEVRGRTGQRLVAHQQRVSPRVNPVHGLDAGRLGLPNRELLGSFDLLDLRVDLSRIRLSVLRADPLDALVRFLDLGDEQCTDGIDVGREEQPDGHLRPRPRPPK